MIETGNLRIRIVVDEAFVNGLITQPLFYPSSTYSLQIPSCNVKSSVIIHSQSNKDSLVMVVIVGLFNNIISSLPNDVPESDCAKAVVFIQWH